MTASKKADNKKREIRYLQIYGPTGLGFALEFGDLENASRVAKVNTLLRKKTVMKQILCLEKILININLVLVFLLATLLIGCATEEKYLVKKPFLYEVSKGNKKGYLFGTMHLGILKEDLPDSFWPYFNSSDIAIFEADKADEEKLKTALGNRVWRKDNEPKASEVLTPAEFERVARIVHETNKDFPIDEANLMVLNGFLLSQNLQNYVVSHGEFVRYSGKFRLDDELQKVAMKNKKVQMTLDSVESDFFMNCLLGTPEEQLEQLRKNLNIGTHEDFLKQLESMVVVYREGNAQKISEAHPWLNRQCLLEGRHDLWMSKILTAFEHYNQPFIAVGALHVVDYKDSLSDKLKKLGFTVRRMTEVFLK